MTRLATGMVLLSAGRVVAEGPVSEMMARLDLRAAESEFGGGALLHRPGGGRREHEDLTVLAHPAGEIEVPGLRLPFGQALRLRVDARDVVLALGTAPLSGISIRNQLRATVIALGSHRRTARSRSGSTSPARRCGRGSRRLPPTAMGLRPGLPVLALIKSVALGPTHAVPDAEAAAHRRRGALDARGAPPAPC